MSRNLRAPRTCGCPPRGRHRKECPAGGSIPCNCGSGSRHGRHTLECANPIFRASALRRFQAQRQRNVAWKAKNPDYRKRDEARRWHARHYYKKAYGLTIEDLERMTTRQEGRCAACGEIPDPAEAPYGKRRVAVPGSALLVDHCHATGKVRGLLCSACNMALGLLRDDANRIRGLLAYLLNSQGTTP